MHWAAVRIQLLINFILFLNALPAQDPKSMEVVDCAEPVFGRYKSSTTGTKQIQYCLYSPNGRNLQEGSTNSSQFRISLSNLSPGVYILHLKGSKHISVHKLLKK